MYLLDAHDATMPAFREAWASIGDSIVVVGGDGIWNCHVHTNDIGAAVEAGIDAGRPHHDPRHRPHGAGRRGTLGARGRGRRRPHHARARADRRSRPRSSRSASATACVASSPASACSDVVAGGQSMNPSTAQILEAVEACASDSRHRAAEQQEHRGGRRARSTRSRRSASRSSPTTSVPEALAALVEYDPNADLDDNEATMSAARERVRTGEVTQAVRDTVADGGDDARRATGSRSAATASSRPPSSPADAVCELLGEARRRRQRDRDGARRRRRRPPTRPSASASTSRSHSRSSRSSSTTAASRSTRISSASEVAARSAGCRPVTRRSRCGSCREIDLPRLKGVGRRARRAARRHGPAHRARPAPALPAPLDRPHQARRDRRARGGRGGDGHRRGALGARPAHAQPARARRGRRRTTARRCSTSRSSTRRGARSSSRSAPRCRCSGSSTCTAASAR